MSKNIFSSKYILPFSVVAIVLLIGGIFVFSQMDQGAEDPQPSPSLSPAPTPSPQGTSLAVVEELENVNFCGKVYKTEQIYINEVSVVQKIAGIASNNPENLICENIDRNTSGDTLDITYELLTDPPQTSEVYIITLNSLGFLINADTQIIAIIGAFDDKIIGSLKD